MNYLFKCLFAILISFNSFAIEKVDWQLCRYDNSCVAWEKVQGHYLNNLTYPIDKRIRLKAFINCSKNQSHIGLYLSSVHDSFSLKLNGKYIQHWNELFLSHESSLIQIPTSLCKRRNILELNIYDLNGAVIGLQEQTLIGKYSTLYWKSKIDYFFKTGLTLLGMYVLFYISLLLLLLMFFKPHPRLKYLFTYSLIGAVYLASFSELPRALYKPELLSGAVHFLLLMLQALSLLILVREFFAKKQKVSWLFQLLLTFYAIFIGIFLHNILSNQYNYHQQIVTVLYAAPLVLGPSIYTLGVINTQLVFDRVVILLFSWCLFLCQLNDLMVFWKVYPGFFTIKFYLPLITIFFSIIHFKKVARANKEVEIVAAKAKSTFHVLHDLKIPLDLLQNLIKYGPKSLEKFFPVLEQSVCRLQELSLDLLDQTKKPELIDLSIILKQLVLEQRMAYQIEPKNIVLDIPSSLLFFGHVSSIKRTLSNLLRNAVQASLPLDEIITIKLIESQDFALTQICNHGKIIDSAVLQNINEGLKVDSENGHGLGLQQVLSCCKIFGWKFSIKAVAEGTQATLIMQKVSP